MEITLRQAKLLTEIAANETETAAWTPGQHSLNWKSDTYTVSRAQIAGCVISDPNLYPVGGKDFSQEPLGSMQALIDFGVGQREAGHPLFILMGGWATQIELDKDAKMCVKTFRFCDGKLYSFAFVYIGVLVQADGTRRCPRWMAGAADQPCAGVQSDRKRMPPSDHQHACGWECIWAVSRVL